MHFKPRMNSVLVAFNTPSMRQDIEVISKFYSGQVIFLRGFWDNKEERSYQLNFKLVDLDKMHDELAIHDQEAYIINTAYMGAFLRRLSGMSVEELGVIKQVNEQDVCCTQCKATGTYWKAIK